MLGGLLEVGVGMIALNLSLESFGEAILGLAFCETIVGCILGVVKVVEGVGMLILGLALTYDGLHRLLGVPVPSWFAPFHDLVDGTFSYVGGQFGY